MTLLFDPRLFQERIASLMENMKSQIGATLTALGERFAQFSTVLQSVFGEEGAGAVALGRFTASALTGFGQIAEGIKLLEGTAEERMAGIGNILGGVAGMLTGAASAMDAMGQQRIAAIDLSLIHI